MNDTLTVAVDPDIVDLAERFVANRRGQTEDWREASTVGDLEELRRLGHELKGTAGAFGFKDLSEIAKHLEGAVKEGDLEEARITVERMVEYVHSVSVVPG